MESNGPEVKVRGPAAHIYERYMQLARDAASSGDRVLGENYLQHADHYFRLVRSMQPATPLQPVGDRFGQQDGDFDGDEEGGGEGEALESEAASGDGEEQPEGEFSQQQGGQQGGDRSGEGGDFRRRRGRRSRFRPGGESEGGETRTEGGERPERTERPERAERPERTERPDRPERFERRERRERDTAGETQEGFSDSPRPAFLRSD